MVGLQHSLAGISLDTLLRDQEIGDFKANWPTRGEKFRFCIKLYRSQYKSDTESLYSLLVEHIGTTGCGSNLVINHKRFKDGRRCYMELKSHFHNEAYKQNLATAANKSLSEVKYYGERKNFSLETYYDIMSKNFNLLELAGVAHLLTEEQKIIKFEAGLKADKALNYFINSKSVLDSLPENQQTFDSYYNSKSIFESLPENQQTFDSYYNTFSYFMNKHNTLVQGNNRRVQISQTKSETYNHNRTRIKRPPQQFTCGRGRGQERGSLRPRAYNSYTMVRNTRSSFKPEARIYSREECSNLIPTQKSQVYELKFKKRWLNGHKPLLGFQINEGTVEAEPFLACIHHQGSYNKDSTPRPSL